MFTPEEIEDIEWLAILTKASAKGELADAQRHYAAYNDRPWADRAVNNIARKVARAELVIEAVKRVRSQD